MSGDLRLHFSDIDQFARHEAMVALLTFRVQVNHGVVFIEQDRDFMTFFERLMPMALRDVRIELVGTPIRAFTASVPAFFVTTPENFRCPHGGPSVSLAAWT